MNPAPIVFGLVFGFLFIPIGLGMARLFGLYTIVNECEAQVFTLFGKVMGTIDEPGLKSPVGQFGAKAAMISSLARNTR